MLWGWERDKKIITIMNGGWKILKNGVKEIEILIITVRQCSHL